MVGAAAAGIECLFLAAPCPRAVVVGATLTRTLPAAQLAATEWTAHVRPSGIARIAQELDAALGAVQHIAAQLGSRPQCNLQRGPILLNERFSANLLVPIAIWRENTLNRDDKKANDSVILSIDFCTPSSYPFDTQVSTGGTRFFLCRTRARGTSTASSSTVIPSPLAPHSRLRPTRPAARSRALPGTNK